MLGNGSDWRFELDVQTDARESRRMKSKSICEVFRGGWEWEGLDRMVRVYTAYLVMEEEKA